MVLLQNLIPLRAQSAFLSRGCCRFVGTCTGFVGACFAHRNVRRPSGQCAHMTRHFPITKTPSCFSKELLAAIDALDDQCLVGGKVESLGIVFQRHDIVWSEHAGRLCTRLTAGLFQ